MTSHWEGLSAENRKSGKSRSRSFQDDNFSGGPGWVVSDWVGVLPALSLLLRYRNPEVVTSIGLGETQRR
jgi:hypothetical protein